MDIQSIAQSTTTVLLPIVLLLILVFTIIGIVVLLKVIKITSKASEIADNVKETTFMFTQGISSSLFWVWDMVGSLFGSWSTKKTKK